MASALHLDWWLPMEALFYDLAGNIHHRVASMKAMDCSLSLVLFAPFLYLYEATSAGNLEFDLKYDENMKQTSGPYCG